MVLSIALALAIGPTIDFEPDGARTEVLLRDLSAQVGRTLIPSAEVRDDVLIISARDVEPDELLDKIAESLEATWEKKGERWTLARTLEQRKERTDRTKRQTLTWVRRAKAETDRTFAAEVLDEKQAEEIARAAVLLQAGPDEEPQFDRRLPVRRAVGAVVARMSPEVLAELPLGERVVFSTKPNQMQRAFPQKVDAILVEMRSQFALLESALAKQSRYDPKNQSLWPFQLMTVPPGKRVDKILLAAKREPGLITLRVVILDQDGLELASGGSDWVSLARLDPTTSADPKLPNTPVELSPESQAWVRLTPTAYGPLDHGADLSGFVRQCATRDPLGFVFTEGTRAYGRALGQAVILAPTDGCYLDTFATTRSAKLSVRTFERLLRTAPMEPSASGGWLIGKQPYPDHSSYERVDRKSLEVLAKAYAVDGAVTLAAGATFAARQPEGVWTGLLSRMLSRIGPGIGISQFSWPLLKVFGMASPSQQRALVAGRPFRWTELSSAQQHAIRNGVLGPMTWDNELRFDQGEVAMTKVTDLLAAGYRSDITEMLPHGLAPDAPVRLGSADSAMAFMRRPDGLTTAGPSTVAFSVWRAKQDGTIEKYQFRSGQQVKWDLGVGLNPALSKHFMYEENRTAGPWGALSALPRAYLDELETTLKQYSGGGGQRPPP